MNPESCDDNFHEESIRPKQALRYEHRTMYNTVYVINFPTLKQFAVNKNCRNILNNEHALRAERLPSDNRTIRSKLGQSDRAPNQCYNVAEVLN